MKRLFLALFMFGCTAVLAQQNPQYDPALAQKLGSDDYGMKSYFLVILKTGAAVGADPELTKRSFQGHMDNIQKLVSEGKLVVAGPLAKNVQTYRGIFIFHQVKDETELKELLAQDLAIKNGLLAYDIFTWFGSAALPAYLPYSEKIWKIKP